LLKPVSGGAGENLCLNCHSIGIKVAPKGSRHAALDMGCDTCHTTHKVGDPEKHEFKYHLVKETPALCLDCHDAKDAALVKAHNGQPFATTNCVSCHNPHQSDEPKLMQAFTHVPFAGGGCDTCHKPAKDGKVVLVAADSRTLCLTCHDEKGKQIESAKVQHPGAQGDCTACHNPHAGKTPGFLQPDPVAACTACHSDIAEQHQKHFPHQPAFTQGCATCHEPHGGENDHLLRAKATNDLCLACHGSDRNPQKVEGQATLTIFDGKVKLPADYFAKVVTLELRYGKGHPVMGHPTSGVLRGTDPKAPQGTLTCLSCHQPHASAQPNLLVKDQANSRKFCETCHTAQEFMNH
jgi:predicted CXXCH cytochrome family protein